MQYSATFFVEFYKKKLVCVSPIVAHSARGRYRAGGGVLSFPPRAAYSHSASVGRR